MWEQFVVNPTNALDPGTSTILACDPLISSPSLPGGARPEFPDHSEIQFPAGTYQLASSTSFDIYNASHIDIKGIVSATGDWAILDRVDIPLSACQYTSILRIQKSDHVRVSYLDIRGSKADAPDNYTEACAQEHGISAYYSTTEKSRHVAVVANKISKTWGDAIYFNGVDTALIAFNILVDIGRESIGIMNRNNDISISGNTMTNAGYGIGVDVEPNDSGTTTAFDSSGVSRVKINNNTITGMALAQIDISAHQLYLPDCKAPIIIRDVTIESNTTSDPIRIESQGKPGANAGTCPGYVDVPGLTDPDVRLSSGQVRRILIKGNESTSTSGAGHIKVSGSHYATVINNTSTYGADLLFFDSTPAYASCYRYTDNNTGFTVSDNSTNHEYPPGDLSVDQFVNQLSLVVTGAVLNPNLVQPFEWSMCKSSGALNALGIVAQFADTPDSLSHSGTSFSERLKFVNDQWIAATGAPNPSLGDLMQSARMDPGSVTLAESALANAVADEILNENPMLLDVSTTDDDFITILYLNGFGHAPSPSEMLSAKLLLAALGPTRYDQRKRMLANIPNAASGTVTVSEYLQSKSETIEATLLTLERYPTGPEFAAAATSGASRDVQIASIWVSAEYLARTPPTPTDGL